MVITSGAVLSASRVGRAHEGQRGRNRERKRDREGEREETETE